jgi:hypothetical protein
MNATPDFPGPFPEEQWAGYLDNELDAAQRQQLDAWLTGHPEAAGELQAYVRLGRLWQSTSPPEPDEVAWNATLAGIETALARRKRSRLIGVGLALIGTAAALLLMMNLGQFRPRELGILDDSDGPFPVVSAADVDVLSMDDADSSILPVGEPRVQGPLEFAGAGDVMVRSVEPDADGRRPAVHMPPDGSAAPPMIVATVAEDEETDLPL